MLTVKVKTNQFAENFRLASNTYGGNDKVCAVVKNHINSLSSRKGALDGPIMHALYNNGCRKFAVSQLSEFIDGIKRGYLWNYCNATIYCWTIDKCSDELANALCMARYYNMNIVLYARNMNELKYLDSAQRASGNDRVELGIVVNIGMNRGGFGTDFNWRKLSQFKNLHHVMMHCWYEKPLTDSMSIDIAEHAVNAIYIQWAVLKTEIARYVNIKSSSFGNSYVSILAEITGHLEWVENHIRLGARLLLGDYDGTVFSATAYGKTLELTSQVTDLTTGEYGYDVSDDIARPNSGNSQIITVACGYSSLGVDPTRCKVTTKNGKIVTGTFKFAMNDVSVYELNTSVKYDDIVGQDVTIFMEDTTVPIQRRFTFGPMAMFEYKGENEDLWTI